MTGRIEYGVRLADIADAAAIATIYNQGIEDGVATFETELRTADQIAVLLREKGDRYPTLVVEHDGRIVAWSGASSYRARAAYAGIADHSVYVDRAWRRRGAGRAALEALFPAYEQRGFWKLTSRIFADNVASIALHERCGFRVVGVYRRHGRLHGVWKDCVVIEKLLGDAARDALL
jgi:phosphinothricin acetyltransferase